MLCGKVRRVKSNKPGICKGLHNTVRLPFVSSAPIANTATMNVIWEHVSAQTFTFTSVSTKRRESAEKCGRIQKKRRNSAHPRFGIPALISCLITNVCHHPAASPPGGTCLILQCEAGDKEAKGTSNTPKQRPSARVPLSVPNGCSGFSYLSKCLMDTSRVSVMHSV